MTGVVNLLNDPVCPRPALPGVDVLEAGKCCPGDAFGTPDHSVKGFAILRAVITVPGSDASREYRPYCCGVQGFLEHCGNLGFPQLPEVIQALPCLFH